MQSTAGTVTSYRRDRGSKKGAEGKPVGLESSELLDQERGQVGNQTIQGFGSLIKDFGLHPKSSGKLLNERVLGMCEEGIEQS